jgi:hypothetical protein
MSLIATIINAFKLRAKVMETVHFIELAVPDDFPATKKLDIALKRLVEWDKRLEGALPRVTELIADAKSVYNEVKAVDAAG